MPGQRMLAKLNLLESSAQDKVLSEKRYRNADFARLYIDSWNEIAFVDPWKGRDLAETGLKLVELLDEQERRVLRPHALAVMGSSYRTLGKRPMAKRSFFESMECYKNGQLPRLDEADLYRRMAYHYRDEKDWNQAIAFVNNSIDICRSILEHHEIGLGLFAKASILFYMERNGVGTPQSDIRGSLIESLEFLDGRKAPSIFDVAASNLTLILVQKRTFLEVDELKYMLQCVDRAQVRQSKAGITRKSLPGVKLRWTKGLIWKCAGATERAKCLLFKARKDLCKLPNAAEEIASITVDISEILIEEGNWGRVRIMVDELISLQQNYNSEVIAILDAWHKDVVRQQISAKLWKDIFLRIRSQNCVGTGVEESDS